MAGSDAAPGGATQGEAGAGRAGAIQLDALIHDLQALHPSVSLTVRHGAHGVVPEPDEVQRAVRELVELACAAAPAPLTVDVETRDLEVEGDGEEVPAGRWVEVVVRDPRTEGSPGREVQARSRIAGRLIAAAQAERGARVIISKSRRGTTVRLLLPAAPAAQGF